MKLLYPLTFVAAALFILLGAYLRLHHGLPFWTDILLGGGVLLSFAAFAGALLDGENGLESAG